MLHCLIFSRLDNDFRPASLGRSLDLRTGPGGARVPVREIVRPGRAEREQGVDRRRVAIPAGAGPGSERRRPGAPRPSGGEPRDARWRGDHPGAAVPVSGSQSRRCRRASCRPCGEGDASTDRAHSHGSWCVGTPATGGGEARPFRRQAGSRTRSPGRRLALETRAPATASGASGRRRPSVRRSRASLPA